MCVIVARYHADVDGPDKVPPAPVARSIAATSDSLHQPAAATLREGVGGVVFSLQDHSETVEEEVEG